MDKDELGRKDGGEERKGRRTRKAIDRDEEGKGGRGKI